MDTYFARHNMGVDSKTKSRIFNERRIAIHFPWTKNNPEGSKNDTRSINPFDYSMSGKKALNALSRLAKEGGYVCAQYENEDNYVVGVISPNSKIEIYKGKWGEKNVRAGKVAILKSLKMKRCKLVAPADYAEMHIGRPRQGTLTKWKNCGMLISNLVESRKSRFSISKLDPSKQEIICQEFLRMNNNKYGLPKLVSLCTSPGRTMKDVDILGIADDNKKIFAQVTFSKIDNISHKINHLKLYRGSKTHLIMFCDCHKTMVVDNVIYFPIKKAIVSFFASSPGRLYKSHLQLK